MTGKEVSRDLYFSRMDSGPENLERKRKAGAKGDNKQQQRDSVDEGKTTLGKEKAKLKGTSTYFAVWYVHNPLYTQDI